MVDNCIKEYTLKDIRTPYIVYPVLLAITYVAIRFITQVYKERLFSIDYLLLSIIGFIAIYYSIYIMYGSIKQCGYIVMSETEITGKNIFKIKRGTIKFNEIKEIIVTKGNIAICLKDIHDQVLKISFPVEFIPLLVEILDKSTNCEKIDIDLNYLSKQRYSGIVQLKENMEKRLNK